MKYIVNVSPTTNFIGDKGWFMGTGFFGEEFSSLEEFREIVRKHVCTDKERPLYTTKNFKLNFSLASTVNSMKEEGNRQCRENGMVELFSVAAKMKNDPFVNKEVYFFVRGKYESDPSKVFHYLMYDKDTEKYTPIYGRMKDVLEAVGITL